MIVCYVDNYDCTSFLLQAQALVAEMTTFVGSLELVRAAFMSLFVPVESSEDQFLMCSTPTLLRLGFPGHVASGDPDDFFCFMATAAALMFSMLAFRIGFRGAANRNLLAASLAFDLDFAAVSMLSSSSASMLP